MTDVSFGSARNAAGRLAPRYRITLASQIPEADCKRVNLGFLDHHQFHLENYRNDPDTLIVEDAGRDLYLV